MKKIILGLAAAAAIASPIALATSASANVAVDNGVGYVGKGDVQTALGWNNKAFDDGVKTLKFTTGAEKVTTDYPMVCMNLTTGDMSTVGHRQFVQSGTATIAATPVLNGNGKQITGFTLTGAGTGFTKVGYPVVRDTGCEGGALVMNTGTPTQPNTVSVTGGLKVNGFDLPNTPVVDPAV